MQTYGDSLFFFSLSLCFIFFVVLTYLCFFFLDATFGPPLNENDKRFILRKGIQIRKYGTLHELITINSIDNDSLPIDETDRLETETLPLANSNNIKETKQRLCIEDPNHQQADNNNNSNNSNSNNSNNTSRKRKQSVLQLLNRPNKKIKNVKKQRKNGNNKNTKNNSNNNNNTNNNRNTRSGQRFCYHQHPLKHGCPYHDLLRELNNCGIDDKKFPSISLCNGYSPDCPCWTNILNTNEYRLGLYYNELTRKYEKNVSKTFIRQKKRENLNLIDVMSLTFEETGLSWRQRTSHSKKPLKISVATPNNPDYFEMTMVVLHYADSVFEREFRPGRYNFENIKSWGTFVCVCAFCLFCLCLSFSYFSYFSYFSFCFFLNCYN